MKRVALIVLAMVIGAAIALAVPGEAHAIVAKHGSYDPCATPVITDVNDYGKQFVVTVEVAGRPSIVKAYCKGKRVHIDRIGKQTWMLPIQKNKTYKIKAKAKHGHWHIIKYKLVRP